MKHKHFEVRAVNPFDGSRIFKTVQASDEQMVQNYFKDLLFIHIYIQEVPRTVCLPLTLIG